MVGFTAVEMQFGPITKAMTVFLDLRRVQVDPVKRLDAFQVLHQVVDNTGIPDAYLDQPCRATLKRRNGLPDFINDCPMVLQEDGLKSVAKMIEEFTGSWRRPVIAEEVMKQAVIPLGNSTEKIAISNQTSQRSPIQTKRLMPDPPCEVRAHVHQDFPGETAEQPG
ncbi:hypothetical protein Hsar01_03193 [Haloferula sargassicola]|uniref:Transposase n=1 Tax=Haloferula sargassicola TaxID=490096 RepID=A0ABP9UQY0_9BACT